MWLAVCLLVCLFCVFVCCVCLFCLFCVLFCFVCLLVCWSVSLVGLSVVGSVVVSWVVLFLLLVCLATTKQNTVI